jgi:hypothetical protein
MSDGGKKIGGRHAKIDAAMVMPTLIEGTRLLM